MPEQKGRTVFYWKCDQQSYVRSYWYIVKSAICADKVVRAGQVTNKSDFPQTKHFLRLCYMFSHLRCYLPVKSTSPPSSVAFSSVISTMFRFSIFRASFIASAWNKHTHTRTRTNKITFKHLLILNKRLMTHSKHQHYKCSPSAFPIIGNIIIYCSNQAFLNKMMTWISQRHRIRGLHWLKQWNKTFSNKLQWHHSNGPWNDVILRKWFQKRRYSEEAKQTVKCLFLCCCFGSNACRNVVEAWKDGWEKSNININCEIQPQERKMREIHITPACYLSLG